MSDLVPKSENKPPPIPADWDYDQALGRVKVLVTNLRSISVDLLRELYIARQKLRYNRAPEPNWRKFVEDLGLPVAFGTVNTWLSRYDPVEHRKIAFKELPLEKQASSVKGKVDLVRSFIKDLDIDELPDNLYFALEDLRTVLEEKLG